jgi:hypothetical protein
LRLRHHRTGGLEYKGDPGILQANVFDGIITKNIATLLHYDSIRETSVQFGTVSKASRVGGEAGGLNTKTRHGAHTGSHSQYREELMPQLLAGRGY